MRSLEGDELSSSGRPAGTEYPATSPPARENLYTYSPQTGTRSARALAASGLAAMARAGGHRPARFRRHVR
jgi:hypothetical protein